jgi:O-antigen/teichoic acid export membrane protein
VIPGFQSLRSTRVLSSLARHRRALSTSVLNQAISSATNFALAFVLVRILATAEYGTYSLGVAGCYLYSGVGNSLFLIQMVVHTPDRLPDDRLPYAVRLLVAVVLFSVLTIVVVTIACLGIGLLVPEAGRYMGLALAVTVASVCFLIKDYFVRQAYLVRAEGRALWITSSIAASLALILALAWRYGFVLSSERALVIFATTQIAGATVGLARAHLPLRTFVWRRMIDDLLECWNHGRWALGSSTIGWAQTQAYAYLTVLVLGAGDVGRANAARLLVSPFLLLTPAINQITMPRLANMRSRDPKRMIRVGSSITAGFVALGLLYSATVVLAAGTVIPLVLGSKYANMRSPVAAWCVVLVMTLLRDGATTLLQTVKEFRTLTKANVVSATVSIIAVLVFMQFWGVTGAILGSGAGELSQAFLLWRRIRRQRPPSSGLTTTASLTT